MKTTFWREDAVDVEKNEDFKEENIRMTNKEQRRECRKKNGRRALTRGAGTKIQD